MSYIIKASSVTNLTDARYFAAKTVDYLGFNIEAGNPTYIDPIYVKAIREWVEGPGIVAELSSVSGPVLNETAAFYGFDAVQTTNAAILSELTTPALLQVVISPEMDMDAIRGTFQQTHAFVRHFILDWATHNVDWSSQAHFWRDICSKYPILLHLNGRADDIVGALNETGAAGLSLIGGEEERVGVKSFDELDDIFDLLNR